MERSRNTAMLMASAILGVLTGITCWILGFLANTSIGDLDELGRTGVALMVTPLLPILVIGLSVFCLAQAGSQKPNWLLVIPYILIGMASVIAPIRRGVWFHWNWITIGLNAVGWLAILCFLWSLWREKSDFGA